VTRRYDEKTDVAPREIVIPLPPPGGPWATLTLRVPMTEAEWDRLMAVLAAMRPGLVLAAEDEAEFREADEE
jgi:hypothetical protein